MNIIIHNCTDVYDWCLMLFIQFHQWISQSCQTLIGEHKNTYLVSVPTDT